ncbi:MAG TPA: MerR family transcriptional regulator [Bacillota bacterium]|nr:MerR family transcriptional regulator [Bacillota bacterium]HPT87813.1 MerR family transcriptional regulator [Bacillota bacterium]
MDVRNCKRCGKIFQYKGNSICPNCVLQDDEDFRKVREYIIAHPNSTSIDISKATGVELKTITRFLREGRLESEFFSGTDLGLQCEKCGREIESGRFCEDCLNELQTGFKQAARQLDTRVERTGERSAERPRSVVHTYDNILNKRR